MGVWAAWLRGGGHSQHCKGPRARSGEGFRSKPEKKYISRQVCHEFVCAGVWLFTCGSVHVAVILCMHVYVHVRV